MAVVAVLRAAPQLLKPDGPRSIWLEVDPSHPPLIEEWLSGERGNGGDDTATAARTSAAPEGLHVEQWLRDISGRPRFVEVKWSGTLAAAGER